MLEGVSLDLGVPGLLGLLGPNGAGKSTLLRVLYRALRPQRGAVLLEGRDLWGHAAREVARRMAVVTQERPLGHAFTVYEVVMTGRLPHQGPWTRTRAADHAAVAQALARLGLEAHAHRTFESLSGGEKQRALIARALAQGARLLLLDEPTNHLDVRYQLEVLSCLRDLEVPVLVALHDLNLAAMYCRELLLLEGGRVVAAGTPERVLTPEGIGRVYGVRAEVAVHPADGRLRVVFLG
nr:ABC transporter ATP-binding protein [Deinobacterium chartae]